MAFKLVSLSNICLRKKHSRIWSQVAGPGPNVCKNNSKPYVAIRKWKVYLKLVMPKWKVIDLWALCPFQIKLTHFLTWGGIVITFNLEMDCILVIWWGSEFITVLWSWLRSARLLFCMSYLEVPWLRSFDKRRWYWRPLVILSPTDVHPLTAEVQSSIKK